MIKTTTHASVVFPAFAQIGRDLSLLTKSRLSLSVVFSSIAGYMLGSESIVAQEILLLFVGGYGVAGAANAFNQIIERELDAQMVRTQNRPLPAGRMKAVHAFWWASAFAIIGLVALYMINPKTSMFAAISMFLYTSVYTPLKPKTALAVFVGAFPGAIPFMLGWVAATGSFGLEAGTLFMIQFFWQFPHFWAIGWMMYDDYKRVGIYMLPTGQKDRGTALQIILYTLWTIVVSITPVWGITGNLSLSVPAAIMVTVCGICMLLAALRLYQKQDTLAAKRLLFVSILYISVIQIIYVIDKFI
jgi:protoheme IX farnesyltransferase